MEKGILEFYLNGALATRKPVLHVAATGDRAVRQIVLGPEKDFWPVFKVPRLSHKHFYT
jgi:hypothetical protein